MKAYLQRQVPSGRTDTKSIEKFLQILLEDHLVDWVHAVLLLGNIELYAAGPTDSDREPDVSHKFEVALIDELKDWKILSSKAECVESVFRKGCLPFLAHTRIACYVALPS
jgi:hypothetical protein